MVMTDERKTAKGDNWLSLKCSIEIILYVTNSSTSLIKPLRTYLNNDYFILNFQRDRLCLSSTTSFYIISCWNARHCDFHRLAYYQSNGSDHDLGIIDAKMSLPRKQISVTYNML